MAQEKRTVNPKIVSDILKAVKDTKNIYFNKKHLVANNLAGDIVFDKFDPTTGTGINRGFIVLNNDKRDIYIYDNGCYRPDGHRVIETVARLIMDTKATNQRVTEVVTAVKHFMSLMVKVEEVEEKYKYFISLKNGVLNVKNGTMIPHSKDLPLFEQMNLVFNPKAECPVFDKYINEILSGDDVKVIQEMFGYILYKTHEYPNFFLLIGSGRNGKTTLLNLIRKFVGSDSVENMTLHELTTSQFSIAKLFGKLANVSGDIGSDVINDTSVIKLLTGNDSIAARRIHHDFINFTNHAKLIWGCNNPPDFPKDKTVAFATRLTFIEFNSYFPVGDPRTDEHILDKMIVEEELSGILNWALEGLKRLLKNRKFSYNKSTDKNLQLYEERANPILGFCNETLEVKIGSWLDKSEVLYEYNKWCVEHQKPTLNEVHFSRKLFQTMYGVASNRMTLPDGNRVWTYKNLSWKDPNRKSYSYNEGTSSQRKIEDSSKIVDIQPEEITLGDKIESLTVFLENNPSDIGELKDNGFDNDFIEMCEQRNLIIKRPDGRYEINA